MKDLGIEALIGKLIINAEINQAKDLVILTTLQNTKLYLTWVGDCCARCFLANVSGSDALVNSEIKEAYNTEWTDVSRNDEDYEVVESMGTTIKTSRGTVTFESRVEHNGYYGGSIEVSDDEPIDQYSSPRDISDEVLYPLTDF